MRSSPWGPVQQQKTLAPGITQVSTASHGGILLSEGRAAALPASIRNLSGLGDRWFEEDCDWALVAIAFPNEFGDSSIHYAEQTIRSYYPSLSDYLDSAAMAPTLERGRGWWAQHKDMYQVFYSFATGHKGPASTCFMRLGDSHRIDMYLPSELKSDRYYSAEEVEHMRALAVPAPNRAAAVAREPEIQGP